MTAPTGSGSATLLPPPVETILIYAAYGWAETNGFKARSGKPRLLEREFWLPLFHALAATEDGVLEIKRYAEFGLEAWKVAPSISSCLDAAFADSSFGKLLRDELRHLVETAETVAALIALRDLVVDSPTPARFESPETRMADRPWVRSAWQPGGGKAPAPRG